MANKWIQAYEKSSYIEIKNLAILSTRAGAAVLHDPPIITPDQIKYKEHNTVNLALKKIRYFSKNVNVRKIFI